MTETRTGRIVCEDERLCRLLENELAYLGIRAISKPTPPINDNAIRILLWDCDSTSPEEGLAAAAACGCPVLLFGRNIPDPDPTTENTLFLRRPFALVDLESALQSLMTGVSQICPPVDTPPRSNAPIPPKTPLLSLGDQAGVVLVNGRPIYLTSAEWAVFECLYSHRGSSVPREVLASLLGGGGNSADVYICHLRAKIEKPSGRRVIHTVRGVGYRLEDSE